MAWQTFVIGQHTLFTYLQKYITQIYTFFNFAFNLKWALQNRKIGGSLYIIAPVI